MTYSAARRGFGSRALLLLSFLTFSCSPVGSETGGAAPKVASSPTSQEAGSAPAASVPILPDDPAWGDALAPVTIVAFVDLQCPFCARGETTLDALRARYGAEQLRIVYKNFPLPFHPLAAPAARHSRAAYELGGAPAYLKMVKAIYGNDFRLTPELLTKAEQDAGLDPARVAALAAESRVVARVISDVSLGESLGVNGTPHFFVNGKAVRGAETEEAFSLIVDEELRVARELRQGGTPRERIYALRTNENFVPPPPREPDKAEEAEPEPDVTAWKVPLGTAPRLGPEDALVTVIEFADLQCPFCQRAHATLEELRKRYGADLRVVWRHKPLPFHAVATPAAALTIAARKKGGDKAFFEAVSAIFQESTLDSAALDEVAQKLGQDPNLLRKGAIPKAALDVIAEDGEVAAEFGVQGTPHFFINGRSLVGAQPIERFTSIIDEELAKAKALMAERHLARKDVFAELQKSARDPAEPERKTVSLPSGDLPSRGAAAAPIVVQMFSDLDCPFCRRVMPTLAELEQRYPGKIRVVYRHLPLDFHEGAHLAATAAAEAFAQKGSASFWKIVDKIHADPPPTTRTRLVQYARELGLDVKRFESAMEDGRHDAKINADADAASKAGIRGTPAFVINGYYVAGAQPIEAFDRVVRFALGHPSPAP